MCIRDRNYAACKLPTYTLHGEQVQMASFSGFKLIGVNPHSANVGAAMLLADFVTNEENEELRFQERAQGPSNINALAAASSPALTAVEMCIRDSSTAVFFLIFVGVLTLFFGWLEKRLDYFR